MANFPLTLTDLISLILWVIVIYAITKIIKLKRRWWLIKILTSVILVPLPYLFYIKYVKHFDIFGINFSAGSFSGTIGMALLWAVIGLIVFNLYIFLWPD